MAISPSPRVSKSTQTSLGNASVIPRSRRLCRRMGCPPSITLLSSGGLRSAKANGTGSVSAMRVCPKTDVVQVFRKSISADFDDEPNKVILGAVNVTMGLYVGCQNLTI